MTIKRKENRVMSLFFGGANRYNLNQLLDFIPTTFGQKATVNVHFEPR
jgi:hypothetical protein